jgi:hypothetical protein
LVPLIIHLHAIRHLHSPPLSPTWPRGLTAPNMAVAEGVEATMTSRVGCSVKIPDLVTAIQLPNKADGVALVEARIRTSQQKIL